jgi:hypothetical protein
MNNVITVMLGLKCENTFRKKVAGKASGEGLLD